MSKKAKIVLVAFVLVNLIFLVPNRALAVTVNPVTGERDVSRQTELNDAQKKAAEEAAERAAKDTFSTTRFDDTSNENVNKVAENAIGTAVNIIRIVGTGISIIMITYMAITYMMAAPQEKADFKKSASIYVLGAVLIFAGTNILSVIVNFASTNIK